MISSSFYMEPDGRLIENVSPSQIPALVAGGQGLLWVDIESANDQDGQFLSNTFHFHPLSIADCISKNIHPPKIDEFEDHLFLIIHGVNYHGESDVVETTELGMFIGKNYVVTSHDVPMNSVTVMSDRIRINTRPMRKGADFLAHDFIDALVDFIMPVTDAMQEKCEDIVSESMQNPSEKTIAAILQIKRSVQALNRVMLPQREILNSISRGDYHLISEKALIYYRNIFDHLVRVEMLCQEIRDMADNSLSIYLSSVANRQNETMKLLAIVAAIFMPLTLLAGIYGMNFDNMPELEWEWGYFVVVGIIGTAIVLMLWVFWARNWISIGRRTVSGITPIILTDPHRVKRYIENLRPPESTEHWTKRYKAVSRKTSGPENKENGKDQ